jgi:hypothetical protein
MVQYYFTSSTLKLALMSICTGGLYELYWFYKNWVLIKKRTEQNIMPFWRAFFAPFWAYSCFKHIKTSADENNIEESLSIGILAFLYFVLQTLWRLPDPYWLVSFFSFTFLIPVNSAALKVNKRLLADFTNNEKFTGWNWAGLVFCGLLFALVLFDMWGRRSALELSPDAVITSDGSFFQVRIQDSGWSRVDSGYLSEESDLEFLGPDESTWAIVYDSTGGSIDEILATRINLIKDEDRKANCEQTKTLVEEDLIVRGALECTGRDTILGNYIYVSRVLADGNNVVEVIAYTSQLNPAAYDHSSRRVQAFADGLEMRN